MYIYCMIKKIMYLCNVIEKQTVTQVIRLAKTEKNCSYQNEKSRRYRNAGRGKRKIHIFHICDKFKDTYFSGSVKILVKNTFFEKIPYKRYPRSG